MRVAPDSDTGIDNGDWSGPAPDPTDGGDTSVNSPQEAAADVALITPTGGLTGTAALVLIPMYNFKTKLFYLGTFDSTDFDTESDSEYRFKQESLMPGRKVTVSRVRLQYRDLGLVTIEVGVKNSDEYKKVEKKIGSAAADGEIHTEFFDILTTGERPQLIIKRKADAGPLCWVEAAMITDVELAEQL